MPEMTLKEKQVRFSQLLGVLLVWVYSHPGWELTLGEGQVDSKTGHMVGSLHYIRLAQDLNLFVGGQYITGQHPVWDAIGAFWVSLDPLCRWGGNFASRDYNHISLEHGGKA